MEFGGNYNFSIILDELLSVLTSTWNMKSQSYCATKSNKVVGLLINLEIVDTRF